MKLNCFNLFRPDIQTLGERHELDQIFAPVFFLQDIIGHQTLSPTWSWHKTVIKQTVLFSLVLYVIIGTIDFMRRTNDFVLHSEAIFTFIIIYQSVCQVIPVILSRRQFCDTYLLLKSSIFQIIEQVTPTRSLFIKKVTRFITKSLIVAIIAPTLSYIIPALWSYANGEKVTLSATTSILMPMTSPTMEIGMFLHLIFFIGVATTTLCVNTWFGVLVIFYCEACNCAIILLKEVKKSNDSYAERLNATLNKFYIVHVILTRYLSNLRDIFKWSMLAMLISVYAVTCVFLLVLTQEVNWRLFIIVCMEFVQVSAFNILGEMLKTKADEMRSTILHFDWVSMNLKDRKKYFIIVCFMNRHFGLCTAGGIELSLVTLTSIYKASYQAYAVINTMNK